MRDLDAGTLVSRATGAKGNNHSYSAFISGDGRYVAFHSSATNLDPADTDSYQDIFVRDRQSETTSLASRGLNEVKGNRDSRYPVISSAGGVIVFVSESWNLVVNDTNGVWDTYVVNNPLTP